MTCPCVHFIIGVGVLVCSTFKDLQLQSNAFFRGLELIPYLDYRLLRVKVLPHKANVAVFNITALTLTC